MKKVEIARGSSKSIPKEVYEYIVLNQALIELKYKISMELNHEFEKRILKDQDDLKRRKK